METPREILIDQFSDGKSPTGAQFKNLIESIVSRQDDGIDKLQDTALKVSAGKEEHAPVIALCPKGILDPQWVMSLKANGQDGLNIGQGDNPANPVLYLDKTTGRVGLGAFNPDGSLEVRRDTTGEHGVILNNLNGASYVVHRLRTPGGDGVIFKNGADRAADGGTNTLTVRNDAGDLRLQGQAGRGTIVLKGDTGFVGIGNPTPRGRLDIAGGAILVNGGLTNTSARPAVTKDRIAGEIAGYSAAGPLADDGFLRLSAGGGTSAGVKSFIDLTGYMNNVPDMNSSIVFGQAGAERMRLSQEGRFGIGTKTPASLLSVNGGVTIGAGLSGTTASPTNGLLVEGDATVRGTLTAFQAIRLGPHANGATGIVELTTGGASPVSNRLIFGTDNSGWKFGIAKRNGANTPQDLMVIGDNGFVTIGGLQPRQKLEVNGGNISLNLSEDAALQAGTGFPNLGSIMFYGHGRGAGNDSARIFCGSRTWDDQGFLAFATSDDGAASKERMRITQEGRVGIGTSVVNAKLHVVTDSSNGEPGQWGGGQFIVGREDANGANSGALGLSWDHGTAMGYISSLSPGHFWRRLGFKAWDHVFYHGGAELMRIVNPGFVGIGHNDPKAPLTIGNAGKKSVPDSAMHISNDCILFGGPNAGKENNSAQISAGLHAANTLCIVGMSTSPNAADRRVRIWSESGMVVHGPVGIHTEPLAPLSINTAGKKTGPDGVMHISNDAILFGGPNNGRDGASASITAGAYQANSLCIVGMSSGPSHVDRKVTVWADGGMNVWGSSSVGSNRFLQKLQVVEGNMAITASDDGGRQHANGYGNLGSLMFYGHGRNADNDSARIVCGSRTWDDQGYLAFHTSDDGGASKERVRIAQDGRVGVGHANPIGKLHVVVGSSSGDVGAWGAEQFIVGREDANGANSGAVALSWDHGGIYGSLSALRPGTDWRPMVYRASHHIFAFGGTEYMRVNNNACVGIGNTNPQAALSIGAGGKWMQPDASMHITSGAILFGGGNNGREANSCQISAGHHDANSMCIVGMSDANHANRRITMWAEGGLGLHGYMQIHQGQWRNIPWYRYLAPGGVSTVASATASVSLWCSERVIASEFNAISDKRIKKDIVISDSKVNLELVSKLEVCEYTYKDSVMRGDKLKRGLIAQQVKTVFEDAVLEHTDFVPDVYDFPAKAKLKEGTLTLTMSKPHGIKDQATVRIAAKNGGGEFTATVKDAKTFSVSDWKADTEEIFVYGQKVDDFMVVDYQRVFAVGISAIQELNKQVEQLKAENEALKNQVDEILKLLKKLK